ncbi:LacI family DNA-binding transcriptional regulator [Candidatus Bipolaricaulota sp. J31]
MRRVTIRDVAALAGVSPSTVSRVLNGKDAGHMRPETKERVLAAIKALDYTPAKAARTLRKRKTGVIAILLPDISNPFFSLLARGVASVAFEHDLSTLICDSDNSVEKETQFWDILLAEGVDGVVFVPAGKPNVTKLERLLRRGVRVVVADRRVQGFPVVEADNRGGSASLANFLLSRGYRRIVYLAGPKEVSTAVDRLEGFRTALREHGLAPVTVCHGDFTFQSGYALAREALTRYEPEAIVAGNDLMAIGGLRAAEDLGMSVPEDLGIAGFDHVFPAELVRPRLTTVAVPAYEIGREAMRELLEGKGSPEGKVLPVELIPGESTPKRGGDDTGKKGFFSKS